jgi:hypothetical protein
MRTSPTNSSDQHEGYAEGIELLERVVAMLTRLIDP